MNNNFTIILQKVGLLHAFQQNLVICLPTSVKTMLQCRVLGTHSQTTYAQVI